MTKNLLALAGAALAVMAAPASAQVFDANGGDGYIEFNTTPYFYTLYGNNNGVSSITTTFSAVAAADFTESFSWFYATNDVGGSQFDFAGYFIDGDFVQLSPNDLTQGGTASGIITITVNAGQTFGAFVTSTDGILGRGSIAFGDATMSVVPEPASWAFMIVGFGAVGAAMRRTKVSTKVRFA